MSAVLVVTWTATDAPDGADLADGDVVDVLEQLLDGATVHLTLHPEDERATLLVDQAGRIAEVRPGTGTTLSADAVDLLGLLGSGLTTSQAARLLHVSARSAYRLLAEARTALGVRTNAEAVLAARPLVDDHG